MAFKKVPPPSALPDSPEKLIRELPRRKIPDVLPHQGEVMRRYAALPANTSDVALQLPTGSGKTLVGLLIAEWLRRKSKERVVYLCPTNQLVHQVAEQAEEKYGLTVTSFTGGKKNYSPTDKASYTNGTHVAVTTYSSVFNSHPFFDDPDVLILDDAHAAENYVASMWSLRVEKTNAKHQSLHAALRSVLKKHINARDYVRLAGGDEGPVDWSWADKLPTPAFVAIQNEIAEILDVHVESAELHFQWATIKDRLHACHLYLSTQDILIRPLIPPTWTHSPFAKARQRIYMSATLGASGDLERLTGRRAIKRIEVPEGWDRQGVGRRFFIFPGMSLTEDDSLKLRHELMQRAGRSLVLVPSGSAADKVVESVQKSLKFQTFNAEDIEVSKKPFVAQGQAVAVVANRYDGIDFPDAECRLLFIEGLPRAVNTQERFLMSRMGANALFNERVQTRVLQAIGRCTRSLNDYSAVVVTGAELPEYLADNKRRKYLHPELQAELDFGVEQSQGTTLQDLTENFNVFLANGSEWEEVNQQIVNKRAGIEQEAFPGLGELSKAVAHEVRYQENLWQGDFDASMESAQQVLSGLNASELQGYRALWHYLAGSAAWLGSLAAASDALKSKARMHYASAKGAARGIPWLIALASYQSDQMPAEDDDSALMIQLEHVEAVLATLGTMQEGAFARREKEILDGLMSKENGPFERSQKLLGDLLGFEAGKEESDASPDPWWIAGGRCFVFEDHSGAALTSSLDATKARQAASHPNWMNTHVASSRGTRILSVLVSPVSTAHEGAIPHLGGFALWPLEEYRSWARRALTAIRAVRTKFTEPGDLAWRALAAKLFLDNDLAATKLYDILSRRLAAGILRPSK
ncbi:DEAD/DEAH box helicase [Corallococcus carmarthensis]|uniref:DEAD/DEAH box helicase n=1 Tax=Corallococcus carmarthensis TaxID=2316728 RepID=UPI00148CA15F|nr:DEAD/DEAH box helicase [Corallococcus carmarthensis]NOK16339.1 DEAD/DEAH box helicase [Corallococcus carmarthensis]